MHTIEYYLELFKDSVMSDILNAPTDEPTINYLVDCLKESYEEILATVRVESR